MRKETRLKFNAYLDQIGKANDTDNTSVMFNVVPTAVQRIQDAVQESSTFLSKINIEAVDAMDGQNIKAGITGPASGRTKTGRREAKRHPSLKPYGYKMAKVDTDLELPYALLDSWGHLENIGERIRRSLVEQIANDRELVGWYGEQAADNSDLEANPMLQDVNKGWMQYMRENLAANVLKEGATAGKIRIGAGGDYVNVDAAVIDLLSIIPSFLRKDLVVLIGDELLMDYKRTVYTDAGLTPTEKAAAMAAMMQFGGLPAETPSNFPSRGLVITSYNNLSIYQQPEGWRRNLKEETEYNRWMDYNSRNEACVVEVPEKFAALEFKNVQLPDGAGGWE